MAKSREHAQKLWERVSDKKARRNVAGFFEGVGVWGAIMSFLVLVLYIFQQILWRPKSMG
jgi:hypothetical protein